VKQKIIITIVLVFNLVGISLTAEDSMLEANSKKYVNQKQPFKNNEPKSFKFVSTIGEMTSTDSNSDKLKKSVENEFNSIKTALTLLRNPEKKDMGTIVGNRGTAPAVIVEGVLCTTFLEVTPAGVVHTLTITDCWDEKKGGFVAIYTRVVSFNNGNKYSVVNTTFNGIAIPWD
jgi:hypothetical protein